MIQLVYIADPMCSWCYGFGPELSKLIADEGGAELQLVLGGLRPYATEPMDASLKATLREHWQQVREVSGLPFTDEAMNHENFVYDTEPACRAVVAVRESVPSHTLNYFHAIQKAFYVEGRNITHVEVLADIAATFGIRRSDFLSLCEFPEIREATRQDFDIAQRWGITGFPALAMKHKETLEAITVGYAKVDELIRRVAEIKARDV